MPKSSNSSVKVELKSEPLPETRHHKFTGKNAEYMCELCYRDVLEIGQIAGGYFLLYQKGRFKILGPQGEGDDDIYTFKKTPRVDPDPKYQDNSPHSTDWIFEAMGEHIKLHAEQGYDLINSCKSFSNFKKGGFCFWLFNKCGRLIQQFEKKYGKFYNKRIPKKKNLNLRSKSK